MASSSERVDSALLDELERVARAVGAELAAWRRRCLAVEAELEDLKARTGSYLSGDVSEVRKRTTALEAENRELTRRMTVAREQIEQLRTRLRFVNRELPGGQG